MSPLPGSYHPLFIQPPFNNTSHAMMHGSASRTSVQGSARQRCTRKLGAAHLPNAACSAAFSSSFSLKYTVMTAMSASNTAAVNAASAGCASVLQARRPQGRGCAGATVRARGSLIGGPRAATRTEPNLPPHPVALTGVVLLV